MIEEEYFKRVDRLFTSYIKDIPIMGADDFKMKAIECYQEAWRDVYSVRELHDWCFAISKEVLYPLTFDDVIDDYIERITGERPTIIFNPPKQKIIEYSAKPDILGLFRR